MKESNVKQRVINLKVYENLERFEDHVILFRKDNASPQDIISALSLFEADGLRVIIDLDAVLVPAGSFGHNIK